MTLPPYYFKIRGTEESYEFPDGYDYSSFAFINLRRRLRHLITYNIGQKYQKQHDEHPKPGIIENRIIFLCLHAFYL